MTALRGLTVLLLVALAGPVLSQAVAEQPLIQIVPPGTEAPAAPAPADPAPAPEKPPLIELAPPEPPPADPALAPAVVADPVARDEGQPEIAPAAVADWIVPLVPALQPVKTEVQIGGSMPQPGQFRLTGEVASAEFLLTLPEGLTPPAELLLALRSSVNVLPDHSHLAVWINGVEAGRLTLNTLGDFAEQRVPAAGLTPGVNRIRLAVVQAHRIFCGPEASFAVWTEVDLGHSGAPVAPALLPLNAQGFLAALQSQVAQGGAIEILVDDKTDLALVRDVARRVTDALGGLPRVEVLPFYAMQTGREARARIALIASAQRMATFRSGAGGALVLQIEHADGAAPDLSDLLPPQPADWQIAALTPGTPATIADLGAAEIVANTHYFRRDVEFRLPEDWLLLASQKAALTLHYGYSADLAKGGLLLVKVNGQTVRLLPLDREGGKVLPPLEIGFRANQLNPGVNTLTFEMTVPGDPPDLPCTPRSTDMLVILGDSSLDVPPSPRMQQTDMARSLLRLGGEDVVIPPEVADPARDGATLLAFGALLRPLVQDEIAAQLHIVGLDAVGLVPTGDTGVTRRMLQDAVFRAPDLTVTAPAPAAKADAPAPSFSLAAEDGTAAPAATPVADQPSLWQRITGWLSPLAQTFREGSGVRDLAFPGRISLVNWLDGKSGVAMLLHLDPDAPDDLWLIAGPDIAMPDLALQVDRFRHGEGGNVHGQVALLQADGTWLTWSDKSRPELLEPLTPWNLRAVLGNYASWSPLVFTVLTLALALLSVIPALLFVLMTRRSGSRT